MIRVLCVDDNPDVVEVLAAAINAEDDMESVGVLMSAERLCEEIEARQPDVVLIDLCMPGRDPLEALGETQARNLESRAIVVSGRDDPDAVDQAVGRGAWGYVRKDGDFRRLLEAIRSVARGEPALHVM